jgi:lipid-A-disaccharide synthase
MIVAGEASGDRYGGRLAWALKQAAPGMRLVGVGGPHMAHEGVELLAPLAEQAVVGVSEALRGLPLFWRVLRRLGDELRLRPPRAVVLIDFPEFNLRLARVAHRLGVPVIYYVPPQLWAWRRGRIRTVARVVSRVFTIFPFERPLYDEARVPVEFVGHPLRDWLPDLPREAARRRLGVPDDTLLLGLLPGSRRREVDRHLPVLLTAAAEIQRDRPAEFVLPLAPTLSREEVAAALSRSAVPVRLVEGQTYEVMAAADLLLVASGTATLEAAWFGTPMVIFYRLSWLSTLIAAGLVRVTHVGLPNLLAGQEIVPELLAMKATGKRLAEAALRLLRDPGARQAQREQLAKLHPLLGSPGVADRAAARILAVVDTRDE